MGVPKGCILSVTLFSVKINTIVKAICPDVDCSLYVDDFVICFRSRNMNIIDRQLSTVSQQTPDAVWRNWLQIFKSSKRNVCTFVIYIRGVHADPKLYLYKTKIEVVSEFKFLGGIFDRKPHISAPQKKCKKALNPIKVVAHSEWGADRKVLLRLNRSLVCSKIDHWSVVYRSACKSYLKILNVLRIP